jgi:hypothetical protein
MSPKSFNVVDNKFITHSLCTEQDRVFNTKYAADSIEILFKTGITRTSLFIN